MKKFVIPIIFILSAVGIFALTIRSITIHPNEANTNTGAFLAAPSENKNTESIKNAATIAENTNERKSALSAPIENPLSRVTKKPYGIYITPATSPVSPEKFSGFHSGVDFEAFESEQNSDVKIFAICDGQVRVKQRVTGYGGVFIQSCTINNQAVTVLYGHLSLASISFKVGDSVTAGDVIGLLGAPYSQDTDGERKHLHLGIHKGDTTSYRGYVSSELDLSDWMNAEPLL